MTNQPPTLPPAGWHPDPSNPNQLRYWDGNMWTEHLHSLDPETIPDSTPNPQSDHSPKGAARVPRKLFASTRSKFIAGVSASALLLGCGAVAVVASLNSGSPEPAASIDERADEGRNSGTGEKGASPALEALSAVHNQFAPELELSELAEGDQALDALFSQNGLLDTWSYGGKVYIEEECQLYLSGISPSNPTDDLSVSYVEWKDDAPGGTDSLFEELQVFIISSSSEKSFGFNSVRNRYQALMPSFSESGKKCGGVRTGDLTRVDSALLSNSTDSELKESSPKTLDLMVNHTYQPSSTKSYYDGGLFIEFRTAMISAGDHLILVRGAFAPDEERTMEPAESSAVPEYLFSGRYAEILVTVLEELGLEADADPSQSIGGPGSVISPLLAVEAPEEELLRCAEGLDLDSTLARALGCD